MEGVRPGYLVTTLTPKTFSDGIMHGMVFIKYPPSYVMLILWGSRALYFNEKASLTHRRALDGVRSPESRICCFERMIMLNNDACARKKHVCLYHMPHVRQASIFLKECFGICSHFPGAKKIGGRQRRRLARCMAEEGSKPGAAADVRGASADLTASAGPFPARRGLTARRLCCKISFGTRLPPG